MKSREELKIYWHPNCSTCKKALRFLDHHEISYHLLDLREASPSRKEIQAMWPNYAAEPKRLFNTSGQAYRTKKIKDKINDLSVKEMQSLLTSDGLLVKRPFLLLNDGKGVVGFKETEWKTLLQL
ncbi:MAG: Spx/MgsR family RNA polymerase-binding regulatory protein [Bdellovibrionales bacterium]|nr:Spx/MgsR family RNA polymerase-binding regulatory protein [Bdellovibrionales bacterium]